jgi:ferritin-like metal-binding protein YciE
MSVEQQLNLYLQDAHAIELQALEQVKRAPKIAGDPEIAKAFEDHIRETERHRRWVEDRLLARSWRPVPQKDIAGKVTGIGMALFARFQPDTPGKLVAHASSYERMELATYDVLARMAELADDGETALIARMIGKEERAMSERLALCFDRAANASLDGLGPDDLGQQLNKYLADAHAIEQQATKLLAKGAKLAGAAELKHAFEEHGEETEHHMQLIANRLAARGSSRSSIKDVALQLGALNLGVLLRAQVDSSVKLACFAYAFEHLEIASYELLKRVATRAEDVDTVAAADEILLQERAAAARIHDLFDHALEASLEEASVKT